MNEAQQAFEAQWARLVSHFQDPRVRPIPEDWDAFTETIHEASLRDEGYVTRLVEAVLATPLRPEHPETLGTWMALERCAFHGFAYLNAHRLPQSPPLGYRTWAQAPALDQVQAAGQWAQIWRPDLRARTADLYALAFEAEQDPWNEPYTTPLLACLRRMGPRRLAWVERQVPGCSPQRLLDWAGVVIDGLNGSTLGQESEAAVLTRLFPHLAPDQWDQWRAQGDRDRWRQRWGTGSVLTATWDHLEQVAMRQKGLEDRPVGAPSHRRFRA